MPIFKFEYSSVGVYRAVVYTPWCFATGPKRSDWEVRLRRRVVATSDYDKTLERLLGYPYRP